MYGPVKDADGALMRQQISARRSRPPTLWGYVSQLYASAGWTSLPWLHRIAAPTLVLTGSKDPIVPAVNARIFAARIPKATVHVVPDAGHLLLMDHAVHSAEVITSFLRSASYLKVSRCSYRLLPNRSRAPTDRDMVPSERREFVRTHRMCVFGYGRRNDGPAMSVVYYVPTDDDELLVSTMTGRSKALAVARDPKVEPVCPRRAWPFAYLQVYADATSSDDRDLVVDVMMAVGERMSGQPLGADARPFVEAMAEEEQRVVIRCRPYSTFAQPPRHLHRNDQTERLTHWISGSVPWDAADPSC